MAPGAAGNPACQSQRSGASKDQVLAVEVGMCCVVAPLSGRALAGPALGLLGGLSELERASSAERPGLLCGSLRGEGDSAGFFCVILLHGEGLARAPRACNHRSQVPNRSGKELGLK